MEAQRLNIKIDAQGESDGKKGKIASRHRLRPPTLEEVHNWINTLNVDVETRDGLIKKVNKYPLDAVNRFRDNFNQHIKEIRKKNNKQNSSKKESG